MKLALCLRLAQLHPRANDSCGRFSLPRNATLRSGQRGRMSKLSVGKKKGVEWSDVEVTADKKAKGKHCELVISNKTEKLNPSCKY